MLSIARRNTQQGSLLAAWIEQIQKAYRKNILGVDALIAARAADLTVPNPRSLADCLIAATALAHELTLVTRNTADFKIEGLTVLNPWND